MAVLLRPCFCRLLGYMVPEQVLGWGGWTYFTSQEADEGGGADLGQDKVEGLSKWLMSCSCLVREEALLCVCVLHWHLVFPCKAGRAPRCSC